MSDSGKYLRVDVVSEDTPLDVRTESERITRVAANRLKLLVRAEPYGGHGAPAEIARRLRWLPSAVSDALNKGVNVWDPCLLQVVAGVFFIRRVSVLYAYMICELELEDLHEYGARQFQRARTPVSTPIPSVGGYSLVRGKK